jgi:hypothetical protein
MVHRLPGAGHHAHRFVLQDQAHQVEEMAAFLDQRAAGVAVEAVPVADFLEEGEAVLADREHPDAAGRLLGQFAETRDGRHVAVFHRHPDRRGDSRAARSRSAPRPRGIGVDRLFHQHRQGAACGQCPAAAARAVVGRGDDERIDIVPRQEAG